jgi:hypothetical protein
MAIKDQFNMIKNNWLIILIVIGLFVFMNSGFTGLGNMSNNLLYKSTSSYDQGFANYESAGMASSSYYRGSASQDFAPEVEERKLTTTSRLSTEVKRGEFDSNEQQLKNIVTSSDSILLSENKNNYGTKRRAYFSGSYQIKVSADKYTSVISQLKGIGEIQSISENTQDITGQYTNAKLNLEVEKERLKRYLEMYNEAINIDDKMNLNDRIFNQERTIKYLEDSINRKDQKIDYSTIHFTLTEERSDYANIVFVKLSSLITSFVNSINSLLSFIFVVAPWAVFLFVVWIIYRRVKKRI